MTDRRLLSTCCARSPLRAIQGFLRWFCTVSSPVTLCSVYIHSLNHLSHNGDGRVLGNEPFILSPILFVFNEWWLVKRKDFKDKCVHVHLGKHACADTRTNTQGGGGCTSLGLIFPRIQYLVYQGKASYRLLKHVKLSIMGHTSNNRSSLAAPSQQHVKE